MILPPRVARADVDIHVSVPPPPMVAFPAEPQVILVPETRVYYVPQVVDYDMYRFGSWWYVNQSGYWYRSKRYQGPFTYVDYDRVPVQIVRVPGKYRHHPSKPHGKHRGHKGKDHKHWHDDDD
jgi:hypothetical protein